MGLSTQEIETKMSSIEEFTELGEWFDRPVRKYSSGMLARLGFGVAVNVDADILLVDEILAVGDLPFVRKCYNRFEQLRQRGTTTVFVSHSMRQVERICDRVIFLENGHLLKEGDPGEVCQLYYQMDSNVNFLPTNGGLPETATWEGTNELIIEQVEILNGDNQPVQSFKTLDPIRIRVWFHAKEKIFTPIIGISVLTSDMLQLFGCGTGHQYKPDISLQDRGSFEVIIPSLNLMPGTYSISIGIKAHNSRLIYRGQRLAEFYIEYSPINKTSFGVVYTQAEWNFGGDRLTTDV